MDSAAAEIVMGMRQVAKCDVLTSTHTWSRVTTDISSILILNTIVIISGVYMRLTAAFIRPPIFTCRLNDCLNTVARGCVDSDHYVTYMKCSTDMYILLRYRYVFQFFVAKLNLFSSFVRLFTLYEILKSV